MPGVKEFSDLKDFTTIFRGLEEESQEVLQESPEWQKALKKVQELYSEFDLRGRKLEQLAMYYQAIMSGEKQLARKIYQDAVRGKERLRELYEALKEFSLITLKILNEAKKRARTQTQEQISRAARARAIRAILSDLRNQIPSHLTKHIVSAGKRAACNRFNNTVAVTRMITFFNIVGRASMDSAGVAAALGTRIPQLFYVSLIKHFFYTAMPRNILRSYETKRTLRGDLENPGRAWAKLKETTIKTKKKLGVPEPETIGKRYGDLEESLRNWQQRMEKKGVFFSKEYMKVPGEALKILHKLRRFVTLATEGIRGPTQRWYEIHMRDWWTWDISRFFLMWFAEPTRKYIPLTQSIKEKLDDTRDAISKFYERVIAAFGGERAVKLFDVGRWMRTELYEVRFSSLVRGNRYSMSAEWRFLKAKMGEYGDWTTKIWLLHYGGKRQTPRPFTLVRKDDFDKAKRAGWRAIISYLEAAKQLGSDFHSSTIKDIRRAVNSISEQYEILKNHTQNIFRIDEAKLAKPGGVERVQAELMKALRVPAKALKVF